MWRRSPPIPSGEQKANMLSSRLLWKSPDDLRSLQFARPFSLRANWRPSRGIRLPMWPQLLTRLRTRGGSSRGLSGRMDREDDPISLFVTARSIFSSRALLRQFDAECHHTAEVLKQSLWQSTSHCTSHSYPHLVNAGSVRMAIRAKLRTSGRSRLRRTKSALLSGLTNGNRNTCTTAFLQLLSK